MNDIFKNLTKSIEEELKNLIYIDYMDERDDIDVASFMAVIKQNIDKYWDLELDLFNFELLGVNLSSFLTALFTICVIVTIVKLCLGR